MDYGIKGRVAMVVGGSKGMDLEVAKMLAAESCPVAVVARTRADVQSAVDHIRHSGGSVRRGRRDTLSRPPLDRVVSTRWHFGDCWTQTPSRAGKSRHRWARSGAAQPERTAAVAITMTTARLVVLASPSRSRLPAPRSQLANCIHSSNFYGVNSVNNQWLPATRGDRAQT